MEQNKGIVLLLSQLRFLSRSVWWRDGCDYIYNKVTHAFRDCFQRLLDLEVSTDIPIEYQTMRWWINMLSRYDFEESDNSGVG